MQLYNPALQARYARFPERCVMGTAPTLKQVCAEYGREIAEKWLVVQINDYNTFVGVKEEGKNTLPVMVEVAQMVINRYGHLKMSEVMLFFQYLKYGDYGEMYGLVDAVRILKALRLFQKDRTHIMGRWQEKEREREQAEQDRRWLEYKQRKQLEG